jgi:transglutaminase-like putative cysteine protease
MGELDAIEPGMLRISHQTSYRYSKRVQFLPHRLVIRPHEGHDLRVEHMRLTISPAHHLMWSRDVFGNSVATVYFEEPAAELHIESLVLVERFKLSSSQILSSVAPVLYPPQYDPLEQVMLAAYLTPMFPDDAGAVRQWLSSMTPPESLAHAEDVLVNLTERIFETIKYRRREEKGVQSPAGTLAMGSGSCRDVATLLMEAARHLGIASRFASGYLDCQATRAARGSTHAWTEIYFPNLGWRGFDPTTGKRCTYDHILVGVSNHPRGVMPVSGRFVGDASSYLGMNAVVSFAKTDVTNVG